MRGRGGLQRKEQTRLPAQSVRGAPHRSPEAAAKGLSSGGGVGSFLLGRPDVARSVRVTASGPGVGLVLRGRDPPGDATVDLGPPRSRGRVPPRRSGARGPAGVCTGPQCRRARGPRTQSPTRSSPTRSRDAWRPQAPGPAAALLPWRAPGCASARALRPPTPHVVAPGREADGPRLAEAAGLDPTRGTATEPRATGAPRVAELGPPGRRPSAGVKVPTKPRATRRAGGGRGRDYLGRRSSAAASGSCEAGADAGAGGGGRADARGRAGATGGAAATRARGRRRRPGRATGASWCSTGARSSQARRN